MWDRHGSRPGRIERSQQGPSRGDVRRRRDLSVTTSLLADVRGAHREDQHGHAIDDLGLGDFEVSELARLGQWRQHRPGDEIVRGGVADDPSLVGPTRGRSGGDQGVEALAIGIPQDPRVAPRVLAPGRRIEALVPARVGDHHRVPGVLGPADEVRRRREADPLDQAVLDRRDPGVQHVPHPAVLDDRPRPSREVVPCLRRAGDDRIREDRPGSEVARDRVSDARVPVAQVRIAQGLRRLQEEHVMVAAHARQPQVPDPAIPKPQHAVVYLPIDVGVNARPTPDGAPGRTDVVMADSLLARSSGGHTIPTWS